MSNSAGQVERVQPERTVSLGNEDAAHAVQREIPDVVRGGRRRECVAREDLLAA
jgi:hypothetical protein